MTAVVSHTRLTVAAAALPMRRRSGPAVASARRRAAANPAGVPSCAIHPDSPSTTSSRIPPVGETITGRPLDIASMQL